jgi:NifU-like protein involved in Fe-S cluster formation
MSDFQGHDPQRVLDHFLNPRNVGDLPGADGVGEVGAVACGDVVRISIKVSDGRITEARFRAYGCGTVIACASATTELLRGRTVAEAERFTNEQVTHALGGLPATKAHCPVLAEEAVKAAVADYRKRKETA